MSSCECIQPNSADLKDLVPLRTPEKELQNIARDVCADILGKETIPPSPLFQHHVSIVYIHNSSRGHSHSCCGGGSSAKVEGIIAVVLIAIVALVILGMIIYDMNRQYENRSHTKECIKEIDDLSKQIVEGSKVKELAKETKAIMENELSLTNRKITVLWAALGIYALGIAAAIVCAPVVIIAAAVYAVVVGGSALVVYNFDPNANDNKQHAEKIKASLLELERSAPQPVLGVVMQQHSSL